MTIRSAGSWLLLAAAAAVPTLHGAEPVLRDLSLRGLRVGGSTTLVISGEELGTAPRLLLPFPARQQLKAGATKNQAAFEVAVEKNVEPGYYQLWVVTADGVSAPAVLAVDALPQRPLTPAVEQLPVALHGSVGGSAVVETRFTGKAAQRVRVEVEARRLGSRLRPVIHLVGPRRVQLAWAWPTATLDGDARLEAILPEDGSYTITLHDAEYAAPGPGFFRLRIGAWSFADRVFPPAVTRAQSRTVELLGGPPSAPVALGPAQRTGPLPVPLPAGPFSGPRPFVYVTSHAEVVSQGNSEKVTDLPAGPVGVSGRLATPYCEDRYRVPVVPGTKALRLEVLAERLGSPLDAALVVRNEQGAELARAEDSPGTLDPVLEYAVPDNVRAVVVGVLDSQGRAGAGAVYRLVVEPQPMSRTGTGFQLHTPVQQLALPVAGRAVFPVVVERSGFGGRVELSADGLPSGARVGGADIPEDADGTLVTVERGTAAEGATITRWRGRTAHGEERGVTITGHPMERIQPWLTEEVALALTAARAKDFHLDWRGLPADAGPVLGTRLALPVKVVRPAGGGVVRLTLLTSQRVTLVNGQPDPNQTLRLEKPVDLPAGKTDGELVVLVPPQLPGPVYDLTVQAQLLGADNRTVQAVAYAPVRRMTVRNPIAVRLAGPARREVQLDPVRGALVQLQGEVERRGGVVGDVVLTVAGLPGGVRATPVTVKAGTTSFALPVILPPGLAAGELGGLKVSGTVTPDVRQPTIQVRSRDVVLTLLVRRPGK